MARHRAWQAILLVMVAAVGVDGRTGRRRSACTASQANAGAGCGEPTGTNRRQGRIARHNGATARASFLSVLKMQAGISAGLDEKEAAVVVAVGGEELDDEVAVLLYVPVTDYQQFIQQLQPKEVQAGLSRVELWKSPFLVRQVKNYAVFGELGQRSCWPKG